MADTLPLYPKRPKFFANYFVRVMAKACLANDIGPEACWLITVIALTEDAKGYREPVTFFNEQLLPLVGLKNVKALDRIRNKAVRSGWLKYSAGGKSKAGRYWVAIPTAHQGWDDAPSDEKTTPDPAGCVDYSETKSTQEPGENRQRSGEDTAREVGKEPGENRQRSGQHSSLSLSLPLSLSPEGGVSGDEIQSPTIGPKPSEVYEHWNSHPGLLPCVSSDPYRDRVVRTWATSNALWVMHWRTVIAFLGRTLFYCGGGPNAWRADVGWLLTEKNFAKAVELMLAEKAGPRLHKPSDRGFQPPPMFRTERPEAS